MDYDLSGLENNFGLRKSMFGRFRTPANGSFVTSNLFIDAEGKFIELFSVKFWAYAFDASFDIFCIGSGY